MAQDEHREIIRRLFTVAGTQLEVAARAAGDGQAEDLAPSRERELGGDLVLVAQTLAALGDVIILLAESK